jgi:hypothetical protein
MAEPQREDEPASKYINTVNTIHDNLGKIGFGLVLLVAGARKHRQARVFGELRITAG